MPTAPHETERSRASLGAIGVAALAEHTLGLQDLSLIFLVAIAVASRRACVGGHHRRARLAATLFIEPRFAFLSAPRGVATVLLLRGGPDRRTPGLATARQSWHCVRRTPTPRMQNLGAIRQRPIWDRSSRARRYCNRPDAEAWIRINGESAPSPRQPSHRKDQMAATGHSSMARRAALRTP